MPKARASLALATACDKRYFLTALNLIGSVQANSNLFETIYVADLGLKDWQKKVFHSIKGVQVLAIEPFAPHWQKCWSWKPWVWNAINAAHILYLDAGIEVLTSLEEVYSFVQKDGYFLVSQNAPGGDHVLKSIIPSDYYKKFNLDKKFGLQDVVGAGILGFKKDSDFFRKVIQPELKFAKKGYCLGWSQTEVYRNKGIDYMENPPVRDCEVFRHDQTVLNALIYSGLPKPNIHPLKKYANYKSSTDYPGQLLWHHRRQSDLPWISHIQFERFGLALKPSLQIIRGWRKLKRTLTRKQLP